MALSEWRRAPRKRQARDRERMIGRVGKRWQPVVEHPILQLELRRIRRTRWWPGRRFFLFYPALLGCAAGYGVMLLLTDSLVKQLSISITALPMVCLLSAISSLLSSLLPWVVPALTGSAIVREREQVFVGPRAGWFP